MEQQPAARFFVLLLCFTSCAYAQLTGVLTYHNDNGRTGLNSAETALTLSNVNVHTFGVLRSPQLLDGDVHAQVLYVRNLTVGGALHNVVFVVTEHDTVYAFDADGKQPSSTQPWLWKRSCLVVHGSGCTSGAPAANVSTVPCADFIGCSSPGFELGITATPVISITGNAIYVVSETKETTGFNLGSNCLPVSGTTQFHCYYFSLHALSLNNGAEKPGSPVLIQYPGSSTLPRFNPFTQTSRPALLLANGNVYVAFGSRGDVHPYHGWIFAYKAGTLTPGTPIPFVSTPAAQTESCPSPPAVTDAGGIWSVGALAADSGGNVFVSTGQGTFNGSSNFGDSFLKLSGTGLAVLDFFTPFNEKTLACNDWDAGSGSPMLLPLSAGSATIPNVMIVGTKEGMMSANSVAGRMYLINRDNMGKHTTSDHVLKELIGTRANPYNPYLLFNAPAYWNHHIYVGPVPPTFSPSQAIPVSLLAFSIFSATISSTPGSRSAADFVYSGANPSVSANGTTNGIVWALSRSYTNPVTKVAVKPALHAFNALNLASELYNSSMNSADALAGDVTNFTLPTIANGKVYATVHYATTSFPKAKLYFFGLLPKAR